jgi:hypothetical protein
MNNVLSVAKQFIADYFTPFQEDPADQPSVTKSTSGHKSLVDHLADYLETSEGAADLIQTVHFVFDGVKRLSFLEPSHQEKATRAAEVMNLSAMALSIPMALTDANTVRKEFSEFFEGFQAIRHAPSGVGLPDQDRLAAVQKGKKTLIALVSLVGNVSHALLFTHEAKITDLGRFQSKVDLVYQGSGIIYDSHELIDEVVRLVRFREKLTTTEKKISCLLIVKDAASIGMGIITITGILFKDRVFSASTGDRVIFLLTSAALPCKLGAKFLK